MFTFGQVIQQENFLIHGDGLTYKEGDLWVKHMDLIIDIFGEYKGCDVDYTGQGYDQEML